MSVPYGHQIITYFMFLNLTRALSIMAIGLSLLQHLDFGTLYHYISDV